MYTFLAQIFSKIINLVSIKSVTIPFFLNNDFLPTLLEYAAVIAQATVKDQAVPFVFEQFQLLPALHLGLSAR